MMFLGFTIDAWITIATVFTMFTVLLFVDTVTMKSVIVHDIVQGWPTGHPFSLPAACGCVSRGSWECP